jgi:8-oxo-dGTP pyrophosphatase MutT (NUDIX family)
MSQKIKKKIMALIYRIRNNAQEFLALKQTANPLHGSANFYVVTGSIENNESNLLAVKREVEEETGITNITKITDLNKTYEYNHPAEGNYLCQEHCFAVLVDDEVKHLNEEHTEYKWLTNDDFVDTISWYYDKEDLKQLMKSILIK